MKRTLLSAVAVIGAGGVGGAVFGHVFRPAPPAPPVQAAPASPRPPSVIVPPGWDPKLVDRVAAIEHRLDAPPLSGELPGEPSSEGSPAADREAQRVAQYQKELDYRRRSLADHDGESLDAPWARAESETIQRALAVTTSEGGSTSAAVKAVDCRSKTCAVTLSFRSPMDGLGFVQGGPRNLAVDGCGGFSSVPVPPAGDGPYELTVLYTCR